MSDSYGPGGSRDDDQASGGGSDRPDESAQPGGQEYPPPPPSQEGPDYPAPPPPEGGSSYPPPPPPSGSEYPSPAGGGSGYPAPPGQGGYGQAPSYPAPPGQQPYPYGGYGPEGYPGGAWDTERKRGWSGLAIASFIVAVLAPCIGVLVAIPLGIVALVKIGKTGDKGKVFAILGIVIPVLWVAAVGGVVAWFATSTAERNDAGVIVESGRIDFGDIRTGDCLNIADLEDEAEIDILDVDGVPCSDEHNAEVAAIAELSGEDDFPGEGDVGQQAAAGCASVQGQLPPGLILYPVWPTEGLWSDEESRRAICLAVRADYSTMVGQQLN